MKTMRAIAVAGPGQVKVVDDMPVPEMGDYDALARIHACGFCNGTDFHVIHGDLDAKSGFGGFPTILGHEAAGEIIKVGKKVRYLKEGDRFINPMPRVNVGNGYSKTWGCMAEYGIVDDRRARKEDGAPPAEEGFIKQGPFPKELDFVDAGVLLSLSECHSAARNFGAGPGKNVLMYGAGPMGIALAMFVKMEGAERITHVDSVPERLEMAKRVAKVDRTINFAEENLEKAVGDELFDMVIDAVGLSTILIDGSQFLKPGGKTCSLGVLKHNDRMVDASLIKGNTMLHMLNFPYGEYDVMPETAALMVSGKVNPKDFYSHVLPFTEIEQCMELVQSKKALKVVLTF